MLSHANGDPWPRLRYPHANNHAALPIFPCRARRALYEAGHDRVVGAWDCLIMGKQRSLWAFALV